MKVFKLERKQYINLPIKTVFKFFSSPENLEQITPKTLRFKILSPSPIKMGPGALIDYTIRLFFIPVHWRTLISEYNPPFTFIDQQLKGPYSFWHHTHTFIEKDGGVEIIDSVRYSIPFGLIGRILNWLWIRKELERIFDYRFKAIENYFSNNNSES